MTMFLESAPDPEVNVCPTCGQAGHWKSDCALPAKSNDKRGSDNPSKTRTPGGQTMDTTTSGAQSIRPPLITTPTATHKQRAPRPERGGVYPTIILGTHSFSSGNDKKLCPFNFDDGSLLRLRRMMYLSTASTTTICNA